jgi:GNAT superfamily N-acetyltransferase
MTTPVTIRTARIDEREALERLQRRASTFAETYREQLLANPDAIDLPAAQILDGAVLVAEIGAVTAGFAVVLPRDDGAAELDGLFVETDLWRSGIGRKLVLAAVARARCQGSRQLHVVANPAAIGFYEACGFVLAGTAQTRFGPAVTMQREIGADD